MSRGKWDPSRQPRDYAERAALRSALLDAAASLHRMASDELIVVRQLGALAELVGRYEDPPHNEAA